MIVPTLGQVEDVLKSVSTDAVSVSWLRLKFKLNDNLAGKLYGDMVGANLISSTGQIKVDKYPREEF